MSGKIANRQQRPQQVAVLPFAIQWFALSRFVNRWQTTRIVARPEVGLLKTLDERHNLGRIGFLNVISLGHPRSPRAQSRACYQLFRFIGNDLRSPTAFA